MVNTASSSYLVDLDTLLIRMRESDDPVQLAVWVIEFINATFAPTLIWLATYDDYHHQMMGQGGICLVADYAPLRSPMPLDPGSLIEQVVIEQQLITIPDLPQETRMGRWQQDSKQLGVQGCLLIPIGFRRRTFGIVLMGTQAWGAFIDDNEKALLSILLGQYAASLYRIEQTWQQQATKQAAAPLLNLSNAIRHGDTLDERLRIALDHISTFVDGTQSQVYAFAYEQSLFQLLLSSKPKATKGEALLTRDLGPLYAALLEGQVITWGSDQGASLRVPLNPRLMQRWHCEAAVIVPVIAEGYLWGFFTVESSQNRHWQTAEYQFIEGVAHLISLAAPLEQLELSLAQMKADLALRIELARVVQAGTEYEHIWQLACQSLVERFKVSACLIVCPDTFEQVYRWHHIYSMTTTKGIDKTWPVLGETEWKDFERGDVVAAEHYPQDLRLLCWQDALKPVKSLMAAPLNTVSGHTVDGFMVVLHTSPRAWSPAERELLAAVAKQVGVVLKQQHLSQELERQTTRLLSMPPVWAQLMAAQTPTQLAEITCRTLAEWLHLPWVGIWGDMWHVSYPAQNLGALPAHDSLYQWAEQSANPIALYWTDIPPESQHWLPSEPALDILLAFYVPTLPPTTPLLVVAGAAALHSWPAEAIAMVEWLGRACGYLTQQQSLTQRLGRGLTQANLLNWYKHRQLAALRLDLGANLRLAADEAPQAPSLFKALQAMGRDLTAVTQTDYSTATPVLTPVPVAGTVRQVLRRLEPVIKQQKLWPRVQGDAGLLALADAHYLDSVLQELITIAIKHLRPESRLEIGLGTGAGQAQILIAGPLQLAPELMQALATAPPDLVATLPPLLNQSPGHELWLCRQLLALMAGNLMYVMGAQPTFQISLPKAPDGTSL